MIMGAQSMSSRFSRIVFVATILVSFYWFLGLVINVYSYPVSGAISEILWLPMLLGLIGLPVLASVYWNKEKFRLRSFYFYSLLISGISILILFIFFS